MSSTSLAIQTPFALSLSKGRPFLPEEEVQGFDKLSPNGFEVNLEVLA